MRSGGTSTNARHPVTENDLAWADVVFAMEDKHKSRLMAAHRRILEGKVIHVLDIPDEFKYMDAELVEQIKQAVGDILRLEWR